MTTQGGFPCVGGAPEARSTANFDDHLSRGSVIADNGPRLSSPAPLPAHVAAASSSHQPTAPAVGPSAFWIDEGAESDARRALRGAGGRAHSSRRRPNGAAAGDFHEHWTLPFGNAPWMDGWMDGGGGQN